MIMWSFIFKPDSIIFCYYLHLKLHMCDPSCENPAKVIFYLLFFVHKKLSNLMLLR